MGGSRQARKETKNKREENKGGGASYRLSADVSVNTEFSNSARFCDRLFGNGTVNDGLAYNE